MASKRKRLSAEAACRQILGDDSSDENSDVEFFFDGSDDDFSAEELEITQLSTTGSRDSESIEYELDDLDVCEEISVDNVRSML